MSQAINQQGILLESGTNEMELLEFYLQGQRFGVNVAKIRQLMPYHNKLVTRMVGAHQFILGTRRHLLGKYESFIFYILLLLLLFEELFLMLEQYLQHL